MSLTDALTEVSQRFGTAQNVKVYCNFAGSSTLQRQIEKGAPADVFVSASPNQMDALQQKGLIYEESRRGILNNRLVLVAPVNSPLAIRLTKELARRGPDMSLSDGLRLYQEYSRLAFSSDDAREGTRAFAERRDPKYQG